MDDTSKNQFSYTEQLKVPELSEGMWRRHDAFTTIIRKIQKSAPDEEKASLCEKAVEDYCAELKTFIGKAAGDMEVLGYDSDELMEEDED